MLTAPGPAGEAPAVPASTASTLFLQWQNAHLQAELRYYQEALAMAKGQLQIQTMRTQSMEKTHGSLQERIEHLELDLGFKAACSGFLGPGMAGAGLTGGNALSAMGLPSGGHEGLGLDPAAAFGAAGFNMPSGLQDISCGGVGINPVQVGGGLLPGGGPMPGSGFAMSGAPGAVLGGAAGAGQVVNLAGMGAVAGGAGQSHPAHPPMG